MYNSFYPENGNNESQPSVRSVQQKKWDLDEDIRFFAYFGRKDKENFVFLLEISRLYKKSHKTIFKYKFHGITWLYFEWRRIPSTDQRILAIPMHALCMLWKIILMQMWYPVCGVSGIWVFFSTVLGASVLLPHSQSWSPNWILFCLGFNMQSSLINIVVPVSCIWIWSSLCLCISWPRSAGPSAATVMTTQLDIVLSMLQYAHAPW